MVGNLLIFPYDNYILIMLLGGYVVSNILAKFVRYSLDNRQYAIKKLRVIVVSINSPEGEFVYFVLLPRMYGKSVVDKSHLLLNVLGAK